MDRGVTGPQLQLQAPLQLPPVAEQGLSAISVSVLLKGNLWHWLVPLSGSILTASVATLATLALRPWRFLQSQTHRGLSDWTEFGVARRERFWMRSLA